MAGLYSLAPNTYPNAYNVPRAVRMQAITTRDSRAQQWMSVNRWGGTIVDRLIAEVTIRELHSGIYSLAWSAEIV